MIVQGFRICFVIVLRYGLSVFRLFFEAILQQCQAEEAVATLPPHDESPRRDVLKNRRLSWEYSLKRNIKNHTLPMCNKFSIHV